jgi:curli biogenesis system outer membrane secretion channel CsgG
MLKRNILVAVLCCAPLLAWSQKIGVITFEDAAGVGPGLGEQVAKVMRSEFLKDKNFTPKFIQYKPKSEDDPTSVDVDKAIELGKKNGVAYVIIGTILEADASSSSTGLGGIRVMGQSVGSSLRTVTATVTLQADLLSVEKGAVLESFRATGSTTDSSVGADVSTEWGSLNSDAAASGNTPNAKALREAVEDIVEQITDFMAG